MRTATSGGTEQIEASRRKTLPRVGVKTEFDRSSPQRPRKRYHTVVQDAIQTYSIELGGSYGALRGKHVKRLNGMDAMLLYGETPNLHMHTLKVLVVHPDDHSAAFTFDIFRQAVTDRLHMLDPLRFKLQGIPLRLHHPIWLEDCEVDLDYHLRVVRVPSPGGRRELNQVIGDVASTPLDRSRPLWEFYFAEGMADNRYALIGKVHHALADGVASATLMARFMGLTDDLTLTEHVSIPSGAVEVRLLRSAGRDHVQQAAGYRSCSPTLRRPRQLRRRSREPRRTAPHGEDVQTAADIPQSRGFADAHIRNRDCHWRGQGDGSNSASHSTTW